jgi:hypothetical protein
VLHVRTPSTLSIHSVTARSGLVLIAVIVVLVTAVTRSRRALALAASPA